MRALLQRVREARVEIDARMVAAINAGLLVLVGIAPDDGPADIDWLARKVVDLRIFDDEHGVMNRAVGDVGGDVLAVSQFTLYASTRKGNRPSWSNAAPPDVAKRLFDAFVAALAQRLGKPVPCGVFGAHMHVALVNDGPVTILLDSRVRE
ncbi:MAG TPA: D-aminoacyl-tRNA deacylase [Casimicrobiaceae bacterium]|nr:D-aminoacyl-tRNA deacylase [Casimicrobiaceae bacterium]